MNYNTSPKKFTDLFWMQLDACPKTIADLYESLIGAIFLDSGFDLEVCWDFMKATLIDPWWSLMEPVVMAELNWNQPDVPVVAIQLAANETDIQDVKTDDIEETTMSTSDDVGDDQVEHKVPERKEYLDMEMQIQPSAAKQSKNSVIELISDDAEAPQRQLDVEMQIVIHPSTHQEPTNAVLGLISTDVEVRPQNMEIQIEVQPSIYQVPTNTVLEQKSDEAELTQRHLDVEMQVSPSNPSTNQDSTAAALNLIHAETDLPQSHLDAEIQMEVQPSSSQEPRNTVLELPVIKKIVEAICNNEQVPKSAASVEVEAAVDVEMGREKDIRDVEMTEASTDVEVAETEAGTDVEMANPNMDAEMTSEAEEKIEVVELEAGVNVEMTGPEDIGMTLEPMTIEEGGVRKKNRGVDIQSLLNDEASGKRNVTTQTRSLKNPCVCTPDEA